MSPDSAELLKIIKNSMLYTWLVTIAVGCGWLLYMWIRTRRLLMLEILRSAWRPVRPMDFEDAMGILHPRSLFWKLERKGLLTSFETPGGELRGGRPIRWYQQTEKGRIALELIESPGNK